MGVEVFVERIRENHIMASCRWSRWRIEVLVKSNDLLGLGCEKGCGPNILWVDMKKRRRFCAGGCRCNTSIEPHQNERDPEIVQVWHCTIEYDQKKLIGTTYTNKMHQLFDSPSLKNFIVKRAWLGIVMRMCDLLGSFLKSMWVRKKHAKKYHVSLWCQSLILEASRADFWALGKGYLRSVLTNKDVEWSITTCSSVRTSKKLKIRGGYKWYQRKPLSQYDVTRGQTR